jgi:cardiolipin hydrolase
MRTAFSPGPACKNLILEHIGSAAMELWVCVFTISDNDITRALLRAHKNGVRIRIITDNEKSMDMGSDIFELEQAGIPVKTDYSTSHMHHKFSIADGSRLITGSYNWTRSAEQYNQENIIATEHPDLVKPFKAEYRRLWDELDQKESQR